MQFYDFEVFKHNWLVVAIDPFNAETTIIHDDRNKLESFHANHKHEIWVGYNSRNYDQYILKGILCGFDPKKINDWIIVEGKKGWEFSSELNRIQLYNYDCMNKFFSLKQLESFMGNDIRETSVPFDIDRELTDEEMEETIKYCIHDVEQTMEVFLRTKTTFDAHLQMLKTFDLGIKNISKTQAQLSALALGCTRKDHFDEWDYSIIDTLKIKKYKHVIDWFMDPANKHDYTKSLNTNVCGVPHLFGWGGLHGAPDEPVHKSGMLIHVDVTSFYPSIMIKYGLLSRNVKDPARYKEIYDTRVALKKAGKDAEQAPFKIILNSTYGICKDPTSSAYDPRRANEVCVNGQLLLLDLLEHLEPHCDLIQSNTDGLIIQIPDTNKAFETIDDVCFEWENRTGMKLGFDLIDEIYQKDVNNYIFHFADCEENGRKRGKWERKGAYVKPLNDLDCDLAIVNKAMVDYMTGGKRVEETINECDDLRMFQKVVKISSKYMCGYHNGKELKDKTFRVFASRDENDSFIGKRKWIIDRYGIGSSRIEKFANTPDHCFICNDAVNGMDIPQKLDKQYYVDLAITRLNAFGVMYQCGQ